MKTIQDNQTHGNKNATPLVKHSRPKAPSKSSVNLPYVGFSELHSENFWGLGSDDEASLQDMHDIESHYARHAH